jgi:hypothetical protein
MRFDCGNLTGRNTKLGRYFAPVFAFVKEI